MRKFRHLSSGAVLPAEPESNKKPNVPENKPNKKNGKENSGRSHDMNSMAFHHELEPVEDELIDWINQNKGKSLMTDMIGQQTDMVGQEQPGQQPGQQQQPGQPAQQKPGQQPVPQQKPGQQPAPKQNQTQVQAKPNMKEENRKGS